MLAWTAGLTVWNSVQERRSIEAGMRESAEIMASAIDQSMRQTAEALASAALSDRLDGSDYAGFYQLAKRLAVIHPEWVNVVLVDASGRVPVNTAALYGTELPKVTEEAYTGAARAIRQVMETGRPAVSTLFQDPVVGRPLVSVNVPVFDAQGRLTHVLAAGVRPEGFSSLLNHRGETTEWFTAVTGPDGRVIARSPDRQDLVGREIPQWTSRATDGSGLFTGRSLSGFEATIAYRRMPFTGWVLYTGAPTNAFVHHLRHTILYTGGFGLTMVLASVLLALAVARRIIAPVRALSVAAAPFVPASKPATGTYAVTELDDLHRALDGLTTALTESETRFRQLFVQAAVMMDLLDDEGRIVEVNEFWMRTLGYQAHEVVGQHPWDLQTPESRTYFEGVVYPQLVRTGAIDDVPTQFVAKNGDVRDVLVSSRAEYGPDGRLQRSFAALRDVTEQRRIEKALARAIEEAERANEGKTRFLAAASHDLRQPLQALSLYVGVLNARLGADGGPVMEAVGQCVDSLTGLLNDMLDVARLDAGRVQAKPVEVPVREMVDRVAASWRIQAQAKGLDLRVVSSGATVRTDPQLMERVLSNLVANAVRYTDLGRVVVGCRRAGPGKLRLEVWDSGIGIPADRLKEIFEEFRQLGNPERRREKGTGLGLAIVQRITDLLGHEVSVRSEPGRGTVFSVTLPLVAGTERAASEPVVEQPHSRSRRILVIEDEAHVRSALELVLTELGHQVAAGETVDSAVDRLHGARPQLVIADYRLGGGVTGVEAIRSVRDRCGDVPAVVLTGDTDPAIIRRITSEGLHLLHKPLQVGALRGFLDKVA